jgi:hypothetical protein
VALRGTLRDFSLGEILQLIGYQRKTGILTVESDEDTISVSFLDGKVVASDSLKRRLENRLGNLLVRARKISPDVLSRALEEQKRLHQRLGFVLISRGAISAGDLRQALRNQILNLIYRLFRWKDGRYFFSQETSIEYDVDHFTPVATENILMEAARMSDEWPIIQARIPSFDLVFCRAQGTQMLTFVSDEARKREGTLLVSPAEIVVWELIDGTRSVSEIAESTFLSDFDVVKALDQLLSRQLVVPAEAAPVAPPSGTSAVPTFGQPQSESATAQPAFTPAGAILAGGLLVLAVGAGFFLRKNPANILLNDRGRGRYLAPLRNSIAVSRLQRVDRGVELYYLTEGRYPENLSNLASLSILDTVASSPARAREYRYILRGNDGKYDLYGKTVAGVVDPNLSLSRTLDPVSEPSTGKLKHRRKPDSQEQDAHSKKIDILK